MLRLTRELLKPSPATETTTSLSVLLERALRTIKRRSLVVIVSDFISQPGWDRPLAMLGQRHEVVAIRLFDPREHELPDVGLIVVEDAESGELLSVDTSDPEFRKRFAEAAEAQLDELRASANRAQVDLHSVSTEDDLVSALVGIAERRRRRR